ncbi:Heterokaryon incompatibility protein (HET) [Rhizoctonia solani]|uniref:Heterokaryon incompatibility protein (HET) n=1 Tax=Rhizoctonia solani TaxID=456999 RepID=A0A8H7M2W7_9AGAM|nr:Heterokaryon incompatibility protein (HET) [Rhizoctonia solani]
MADYTHFLQKEGAGRRIYDVDLRQLSHGQTLYDLGSRCVKPEIYRFIECSSVIQHKLLKIREYCELPKYSYAVVSHVWDGATTNPGDNTFAVRGGAGVTAGKTPINVRVLEEACLASLKMNLNLLWIDRLCIIQSEQADKKWHLKAMHSIYQCSALCIVIPDGLAQLACLNQETPWINRGWTLQEAVAPNQVQVLFAWQGGESWAKPHIEAEVPHYITHVTKGYSAMAPLALVLDCCISGTMVLIDDITQPMVRTTNDICIFGSSHKRADATHKDASPGVAMLAAVISTTLRKDEDQIYHCLWKCMLTRATRYPADMIFSIMGLFGVTLNPDDFSLDDYVKPAIALAKELLNEQHKPATWLGASFLAPPCPSLSTFPVFPTSPHGRTQEAMIKWGGDDIPATSLMTTEFVASPVIMPKGRMDDRGYFEFTSHSLPVTAVDPSEAKNAKDDGPYVWGPGRQLWKFDQSETEMEASHTFAVFLGFFSAYSPAKHQPENSARVFIVGKQSDGNYQLISYAMLTRETMKLLKWKLRKLNVGGQIPPESIAAQNGENNEKYEGKDTQNQLINSSTTSKQSGTIDQSTRGPFWVNVFQLVREHRVRRATLVTISGWGANLDFTWPDDSMGKVTHKLLLERFRVQSGLKLNDTGCQPLTPTYAREKMRDYERSQDNERPTLQITRGFPVWLGASEESSADQFFGAVAHTPYPRRNAASSLGSDGSGLLGEPLGALHEHFRASYQTLRNARRQQRVPERSRDFRGPVELPRPVKAPASKPETSRRLSLFYQSPTPPPQS